jgi:hypothetical protein
LTNRPPAINLINSINSINLINSINYIYPEPLNLESLNL